jgi:hypothetical protein
VTRPIRGCGINSVFGGKGKIRQELYIDRATPQESRAVFDALYARREEFEAAYGRRLEWDSIEGRKRCRIFESAEGDVANDAEHEKYIVFFLDAGERFRKAISAVNGASL